MSGNNVTDIMKAEEGQTNPLNDKPFSNEYKKLLDTRRGLPIAKLRGDFFKMYHDNKVMIVVAPAGSGKSTQIPAWIYLDDYKSSKGVTCTQPRRIAATSLSARVATELDVTLGEQVGFRVRFEEKGEPGTTKLVYQTDGMLLANYQGNLKLGTYRCIIIDEAHERTVSTDILMAHLKKLVKERDDLKVIIMLATLDAEKFSEYFDKAPVFNVPGRTYPVDIGYLDDNVMWLNTLVVDVVQHIHKNERPGNIIVFLPGTNDIEGIRSVLASAMSSLEVIPLYSALSPDEQRRAFLPSPVRKCILTTNIAETSITLPDIVFVVDSGLSRTSYYNPRACAELLSVGLISQPGAQQRAGLAGRTGPGVCYRLYSKDTHDRLMRPVAVPAILRTSFRKELLRLLANGVRNPVEFDLMDPPAPETLMRAYQDLIDLELVHPTTLQISEEGKLAAAFPGAPEWFVTWREARKLECAEAIIGIAAIASLDRPIFLRPARLEQAADHVRMQFAHPHSDHISELNAFNAYYTLAVEVAEAKKKGKSSPIDLDKWCKDHFLSKMMLDEVIRLRYDYGSFFVRRIGKGDVTLGLGSQMMMDDPDYSVNIRMALARGLRLNVAKKLANEKEKKRLDCSDCYVTVHGNQEGILHPQTVLHNKCAEWVVYNSLEGNPLQVKYETATAIEPEWVAHLAYFSEERMARKGKFCEGEITQKDVLAAFNKARNASTSSS